jgi:hypothetical protein
MKKKIHEKKLALKKLTVAQLSRKQQADVKGGELTVFIITAPRSKDWSCRDTVCCC